MNPDSHFVLKFVVDQVVQVSTYVPTRQFNNENENMV